MKGYHWGEFGLPGVFDIYSRLNFTALASLSITKYSISESTTHRRKYLSYKMSNGFPNQFQFPTTSRRLSENTISFCTNQVHIQLFTFEKLSWGTYHQRNVQGYFEAICLQSFKNQFCSYSIFVFFSPFKYFVKQISHNSICLGKKVPRVGYLLSIFWE